MLVWPVKDPDEILDYSINWAVDKNGDAGRLPVADDQLASSTWIVPSGINHVSDAFSPLTNITTIWLSGGSIGATYTFVNRITSVGGRTMDQSVRLRVKTK